VGVDDMGEAREHVMNFKVSKEEMEMIRRGAAAENTTPSEYCRSCVYRDRTIERDKYAVKRFKENIANFAKSLPANIKKAIEELIAPRKEARKAMAHIGSSKSKGK